MISLFKSCKNVKQILGLYCSIRQTLIIEHGGPDYPILVDLQNEAEQAIVRAVHAGRYEEKENERIIPNVS